MQNRADAIEYLRGNGFHAHNRDWSLGESIMVGAGYVHVPNGISYYERAAYIYREEDRWAIYDLSILEEHPTYATLQDAVFEVERRLRHVK